MRGRLQYTPPWQSRWLDFRAGHGGDEFGNCSWYLALPLSGEVAFFPGTHYQTDVELPEPGECPWVDRRFYRDTERDGR